MVIYGINPTAGRIMVMNPSTGSITCYYTSGGYYYTNSSTGVTYTLSEGVVRYTT
jgi:hypothetical protein